MQTHTCFWPRSRPCHSTRRRLTAPWTIWPRSATYALLTPLPPAMPSLCLCPRPLPRHHPVAHTIPVSPPEELLTPHS